MCGSRMASCVAVSLLLICLLIVSDVSAEMKPAIPDIKYQTLEYQQLRNDDQLLLKAPHVIVKTAMEENPVFGFELPHRSDQYSLRLRSIMHDGRIFFPILVFLDSEYKLLRTTDGFGEIESSGYFGYATDEEIPVPAGSRFMVITSSLNYLSSKQTITEASYMPIPVDIGGSIARIPVAGQSTTIEVAATLTPRMELVVPAESGAITNRHVGWYGSFGSSFGEQDIADNPDGDDYAAGSGALLMGGYAFPVSAWGSGTSLRLGAGIRYQGGDGHSAGLIGQGSIIRYFGVIGVGAALFLDSGGTVKGVDGSSFEFEPLVMPKLMLEYNDGSSFTIGAEAIGRADYVDSDTGRAYGGPTYGAYVSFRIR